MENDGPVSAVQIRLAKGEITTTQYKEILSNLMKNISSFQQTSSLKTLQIRYAKSEVSAEQYHESLTNLMKNLYSHPWSPPLHILHDRYAQGEITSEQYEEMFNNLTQEEFSYDKSTPLWLINNRYARGELTTPEYEEILSLFTEYTLHLQQSVMSSSEGGMPIYPDSEKKKKIESVPTRENLTSRNIPTSNLNQAIIQQGEVSDNGSIQHDVGSSMVSAVLPDQPVANPEEVKADELPAIEETLVPDGSETLPEGGTEGISDSEVLAQVNTEDSNPAREEEIRSDSVPVHDALPVISDDSRTMIKPGTLPRSIDIPDLKPGLAAIPVSHQFPSSSLSIHHGIEALPTDFLYPGGKHGLGMIAEEAGIPSNSEIGVSYSITPVSSSGGRANTYETVTSSISHSVPESGLSDMLSAVGTSSEEKTNGKSGSNIRQQIKTLIVKGDYNEAIKLAETMITKDDQDYLPFFYKGMARYYLNIHSEALLDLDHARELCKNKDEIRKIDTIREHILCKQRKTSESGVCADPAGNGIETEQLGTPVELEQKPIPDNLSEILDSLDKKEFKNANIVLLDFIGQCKDLPLERLQAESVDEIYAAMGYVRYQLKDYIHAKEFFQDALAVNAENEVANQFMKDILIRAARKK